jgi:hypothetical protein
MRRFGIVLLLLCCVALAGEINMYESFVDFGHPVTVTQEMMTVNMVEFTMANDGVIIVLFEGVEFNAGRGRTGGSEGDIGLEHGFLLDGNAVNLIGSINHFNYMSALTAGSHKFEIYASHERSWEQILTYPTSVSFIQVLVLEQDLPPEVGEPPLETEELSSPNNVISYGSSLILPGCVEVLDISGRKVDCEIKNGVIPVGELPNGTYFARTEQDRVVKITRVK